ncbi:PHB depolymerase family esterase [Rugamonas sp.]|uniref:extracellular catalytic domain type 1 short-chain-length polyhydroxyalkanoate depolymerase n=1 Tax=Rugamonas sp. TaxID=1926287 RepID=UPI0025FFCD58|nr:PHB depolymerase family esterase [Rugamonas sp.]
MEVILVKLSTGTRLLRSLVRSGKAQRRTVGKLVSQLFEAPKPARKAKAKAKAEPKLKAAPKPLIKAAAPAVRRPSVAKAPPHAPPAPGKWLAAHYTAPPQAGALAGRRMSYWLYLPENVPQPALDSGLPLVVMLHGCHQTATQFAQGTRMNQLAERAGYAVLYPQQLVSTQAQRCWKWYDKATQDGGGDVPTIAAIIDKVAGQYRIDRSRIYIAGMSAGAGMANIVALHHPRLIAALGLHSGPMFGAGHSVMGALGVMQHGAAARVDSAIAEVLRRQAPFPAMPTMLIQGQGDKVVRPINQIELARQGLLLNRLSAGGPSKMALKPAGRGRNAHEIRDFYAGRKVLLRVASVAQLGHAWSGGDASLAYNDQTGPDASKMLLDFFARHRRVVD